MIDMEALRAALGLGPKNPSTLEMVQALVESNQALAEAANQIADAAVAVAAQRDQLKAESERLRAQLISITTRNFAEGLSDRAEGKALDECLAQGIAMQNAEVKALMADAERFRSIVSAVVREHPGRRHLNGNAPGHAHRIPGIWDSDNGELSGTECAWCKTWNAAVAATEVSRHG